MNGKISPRSAVQEGVQVALVLVLAAVIVILPAGRRPVWDGNEARYALLARDILERGNWLVARLREEPYVYKPQLHFWLVTALSWPTGAVTPMTAALPSVLATVAATGGVIAVGRFLWGRTSGLLAGLIFATSPLVFSVGHEALPDGPMDAWFVWALYALLRSVDGRGTLGPLLGFAACLAGALLTKGPPALTLLAAVAVTLTQVHRPPVLRLVVASAAACAVAALVWLAPYIYYASAQLGQGAIKGEYLAWFGRWSLHSRLASLYSPLFAFLPWTLLLVAAPWHWRSSPERGRRLVGVWTLALWVAIALAGRYRAKYLLPVFPGFALLTPEFVTARLDGAARTARRVMLVVTALVAGTGFVMMGIPALRSRVDIDNRSFLI